MNDWKRKWTLKLNANIWSTNIFWFVWTLGGQFSISMYNENNHNHDDDDDNDDHNDKYRFRSILCYQNLLFIILMMMNYVYQKNNNVYYNSLPFHLWYDMFFMVITILNSFRKMIALLLRWWIQRIRFDHYLTMNNTIRRKRIIIEWV